MSEEFHFGNTLEIFLLYVVSGRLHHLLLAAIQDGWQYVKLEDWHGQFCCQSLSLILVMDDSMLKLKIGPYLGWFIFLFASLVRFLVMATIKMTDNMIPNQRKLSKVPSNLIRTLFQVFWCSIPTPCGLNLFGKDVVKFWKFGGGALAQWKTTLKIAGLDQIKWPRLKAISEKNISD